MPENIPTPESELGGILELQELFAQELGEASDQLNLSRSFMPLTNGLGLESPKKKEVPPIAAKLSRKLVEVAATELGKTIEPPDVWEITRTRVLSDEKKAQAGVEASTVAVEEAKLKSAIEPNTSITPPPVPRTGLWRRGLAAFVDELFVLSCFSVILVITANLLTNSKNYFSLAALANVHQPVFFRYALMEFSALWLSYFAICLGILDMTFGMWVWGIRVGYADQEGNVDSKTLKKMTRILLSFFFFAPMAPLILLFVRIRGKNLLDGLSKTHLYRTVV